MDDTDAVIRSFEMHRTHLRAVAYRMLGSLAEADDVAAVGPLRYQRRGQPSWVADDRRGTGMSGHAPDRTSRREDPVDVHLPTRS